MWFWLMIAVVVTAGLVGGWAAWRAIRDRPVILRQLWASAIVEVLLLFQVVVAVVLAARGDSAGDAPTFWGYLITALFVLPVAAAWAFAERSRWSSVVLLVAALTVMFLQYRLWQLWAAA